MPPARALILDRARLDFEHGLERLTTTIREGHSRPVAAALEATAHGMVRATGLRADFERDAKLVLDLAEEVAAGADPQEVARQHLADVLKLSRLGLVVRLKDDAAAALLQWAEAALAARLPDLARLVSVEGVASYEEVVRRAFPDRDEVDAVVKEQAAFAESVIAHFEAHPRLLRIPDRLVPRLAATAHHMVTTQVEKVGRTVDRIYGDGP